MNVNSTNDYIYYEPTYDDIEEAKENGTGRLNEITVNYDSQIFGYLAELAFNHYYGVENVGKKHGFYHVGKNGKEQRWDFAHISGLTVDVKSKPRDEFPPPITWNCGYMKLPTKVWGKSDWLVFAAVRKDLNNPTVALIGREKTETFKKTAKYYKKGEKIENMYKPLKFDMYSKKYLDLRRMPQPPSLRIVWDKERESYENRTI